MKTGIVFVAVLLLASAGVQAADEYASPEEAQALVSKAVAAIKADRAGTFAEMTAKNPKWIDRDLYPLVYDINGKVVAHGQNPKMVGKDLIDFKDPDGKLYVRERVELAKNKGKFWQDYKFTDPLTKKVLPKRAWCERLADDIICAGVYTR